MDRLKALVTLLYKKIVLESDTETQKTQADAETYRRTDCENITAMVANALAVYALADSTVSVDGDSVRAELLRTVSDKQVSRLKHLVADCLGTGLLVSVPCTHTINGKRKIFIDNIPKDRFFITGMSGDDIISCTVASDVRMQKGCVYVRMTDYALENGVYVIRCRAARDGSPAPLDVLPDWEGIPEEIAIGGVDRLPIGIMRCPTSSRRPEVPDGVPVTYGCDATLKKIADTLKTIEDEYKLKSVRVFAHESLFDKNDKIEQKLYKMVDGDDPNFFEIFSPEIRQSAYFEKLKSHFAMLEKEIGCSAGVLTDLETGTATATEIRAKMYKTFAFCTDIQKAVERYYNDLMYGCEVLANYFGLTPDGEYNVVCDWSYGLLEDSTQTYAQYKDGVSEGVIKKAELRSFITGETLDDAQAAVDEIEQTEPSLASMLSGGSFGGGTKTGMTQNAE
ncbi:MAG: hypothetical protein ACI4RV_06450 [Eubacteriales bacterium]